MYNKGPAHDLCTDIEELGNHALCVILQREDATEGDEDMHVVVGIANLRHLGESHQQEHCYDDESDDKIGRYQHTQVGVLQYLKLSVAQ